MTDKRVRFAWLAVLSMLVVSLTIAWAQYGEPPMKQPPPQEMKMQPPMMGPPMGGTAVTSDGTHLFIVSGINVYKVRKSDLTVEKTAMLPPMHMHEGIVHKADVPPPKKKGGDGS